MAVLSLFDLHGKRALVTGGSRGLGREIALALAEAGADILIVARNEETLARTATEIRTYGHQADCICADISRPEQAAEMAESALREYGHFDILVNNVGNRLLDIPTEDLELTDWQAIVDLNLSQCFACCKVVGTEMIKRRRGRIINIASISGIIVNRGIHGRAYETSKAAVRAFTKTLAADWAPYNINVNAIAPGFFLTEINRNWFNKKPELEKTVTDQIPMGRCGEPQEIGALAVYLASEASSYMTGSVIVIDGGFTLW